MSGLSLPSAVRQYPNESAVAGVKIQYENQWIGQSDFIRIEENCFTRHRATPPPPEWRTSFRMNAWEKGWACTDFRWPYQLPWHPHWVWQWWTYCASFVNGRIRNWIAIGYREYKCKSSLLLWKRKRGRMLCIFPLALVRIDIYKRLTIFQAWAGNRISSESK